MLSLSREGWVMRCFIARHRHFFLHKKIGANEMTKLTASKLIRLGLGTALAGTMLAAPLMASAGGTADITVANMYLWRGLDLSNKSGAEVSGDLYYHHESGAYTGIWMSSEGVSNSHETDLNLGFSKSFGDFGMDVGIYEYLYTENGDPTKSDWDKTDAAEYYVAGSYGPVSLKVLQSTSVPDNRYFTLDGSYSMFGAHIGKTSRKDSQQEYTDFNLSVHPVENLTLLVSMATGKLIDNGGGEKDPLFVVSYNWPFTMK
jgi:uncharacterized protein (TIGR02001 family)